MTEKKAVSVFWFRRDLRINDNAGLFYCLRDQASVLPLFIFDEGILAQLEDKSDRRVDFIHQVLQRIQKELTGIGSSLLIKTGNPETVFTELLPEFNIKAVYANHDYEPYAIGRDERIKKLLSAQGIDFQTFKDQVVFEKDEVLKDDGKPYTIFTPYMRKWKSLVNSFYLKSYSSEKLVSSFLRTSPFEFPSLEQIGFKNTDMVLSPPAASEHLIRQYSEQRNYPAIQGTSRLSIHLRFGTVSIRELAVKAFAWNETWLNELIWREFYMMILYHFPHVVNSSFKPAYDQIPWRNREDEFARWCEGSTGFPIVDAGMRELNETGFMHNRVRMITASFLVKDLLIDWRWGEAYFAKKLNDFELASNNGGWQWAAGSGCDAAPYFRIFNPTEQAKKFDPELKYIRKWVFNVNELTYPQPMVDHKLARERTLNTYKKALNDHI